MWESAAVQSFLLVRLNAGNGLFITSHHIAMHHHVRSRSLVMTTWSNLNSGPSKAYMHTQLIAWLLSGILLLERRKFTWILQEYHTKLADSCKTSGQLLHRVLIILDRPGHLKSDLITRVVFNLEIICSLFKPRWIQYKWLRASLALPPNFNYSNDPSKLKF